MFGRRFPRSRSRSGRPTRGISERPRRRSPLDSQPARPRTKTSRAQQSQMSTMSGVRSAPRSAYQQALKAKKVMDPRKVKQTEKDIFNQISNKILDRHSQEIKYRNTIGPDYSVPAKRMPRPEPIKETKTYTPRKRMPRPEPIKETKTYTPRVKRMSEGGMATKNAKGHNDYRKTGTTLSVKDNRKNK